MGDSGDSSSASDCGSPQPKGRSTSKVFVWLKEKAKCTPRGNPWVLLNREGRVKDVAIQGNYSSAKMQELVKENFAGLAAVDLNRIRLYKSANRGSRIEKVFKGIPDAKELLRIYGRGRANSRRIYMVLHRPRNGGSNTNPQSTPTPGVSNPNHPSPSLQTNPNFDVASLHPSTSQSQLSPPPAQPNSNPSSTNQSQPSLPPAQPNSNPPSTNQSQPSLPSAQPNSNPPSTNHFQPSLPPAQPNSNPPLLSRQSTTHQNPSQSQTSVTNSVIQPETSSGATSAASGVVGLVDLTLPTSEYGVIALDEVSDNELDRSYLASNPVNVDPACHLTGIHQWQKAGIVKEDQSSLGILNQNAQVPLNDMDRTQEVLSCEHVLMEAASTHEDILLPIFLTLTYEELCHQARSDRRSMVIVILKGDNIPDVIRILNILRRSNGNAYFWITKENSKSGREVKRKFGSTGSDLLIMAPTTSRPILIERFCATVPNKGNINTSC